METTWHNLCRLQGNRLRALGLPWRVRGCIVVADGCLATVSARFCLQAIAIVDEIGRQAYHIVAPVVLPTLDHGLRTVDGMSKQYLGWDTRLHSTSNSIWT